MIVCIPKVESNTAIGGGWSFMENFTRAAKKYCDVTDCVTGGSWDIALIPAATMVERHIAQLLFSFQQTSHKKVFLRVDGVPENWRNRGTGWSRLKEYTQWVNGIIYQSQFSHDTVGKLLGKEGKVIYNGVNTSVFTPKGEKFPQFGDPSIIFVHYRNDPNKRIEEVIERYRYYKLITPSATLTFIGNYPKEKFYWNNEEWDFGMLDYKSGKDWQFVGIISDKVQLAKMLRSGQYIAYPSFADPCPNTLIEALSCGLKPLWINNYGGASEICNNWDKIDWSADRMAKEYLEYFHEQK